MKNYFIHILALAVLCEVCHAYTEMVLNEMDTDFKLAVKTYYKIMRAHCHSGPTSFPLTVGITIDKTPAKG